MRAEIRRPRLMLCLSVLLLGAGLLAVAISPIVTEEQSLVAPTIGAGDEYGRSVAIAEGLTVVGAWHDEVDGDASGSAHVFQRDPDGWNFVRRLLPLDAADGDRFGVAVSVDGNTVVVGAYGRDDSGTQSGAAYVFHRDAGGLNQWNQTAKLTAPDAGAGDRFGIAVDIHEDRIVVTSDRGGPTGSGSGAAYLYGRNVGGASNWGYLTTMVGADASLGDGFGRSVSIDRDQILVGASPVGGAGVGAAYLFGRNAGGENAWGEIKKLTPAGGLAGDEFGATVAISGGTAAIGAPGTASGTGSTYIFDENQDGAGNWGEVRELTTAEAMPGTRFGAAVSIDRDAVVVGANHGDAAFSGAGSGYLFLRNAGGFDEWGEVLTLAASDAAPGDEFGGAISIDRDRVIVGASRNAAPLPDSGSAYQFAFAICGDGIVQSPEGCDDANTVDGDGCSGFCEPEPCVDEDLDGAGRFGSLTCSGGTEPDCDDDDPARFPNAIEICDGIDNDCNGRVDDGGFCAGSCDPGNVFGGYELIAGLPTTSTIGSSVWTGSGFGVVWGGVRNDQNEYRFAVLDEEGQKIGTEGLISTGPVGGAGRPNLAWNGTHYGVTWHDQREGRPQIYFALVNSGGHNPAPEVLIPGPSVSENPVIAWTGESWALIWQDLRDFADGEAELYYARLSLDGDIEVAPTRITSTPGRSARPSIVWNGSTLAVVWEEESDGNREIYFQRVGVDGTPGASRRLTFDDASSDAPQLLWTGEQYGLTWADRRGEGANAETYFAQLDVLGNKLAPEIPLTAGPGRSTHQQIAWTGEEFGLVWQNDAAGADNLFYAAVSADGVPTVEATPLPATSVDSTFPSLNWTGDRFGLSWSEDQAIAFRFLECNCVDVDGDGFSGCVECDDSKASVFPGAPEICDGRNNDCDDPEWPAPPPDEIDSDADGVSSCQGDCNDDDNRTFPGAEQICDGANNDCDDPGWPALPEDEADGDDDGLSACAGDCDDRNDTVLPGAPEFCDGIDNDCDGVVDEDAAGQDSDVDGIFNACDNCVLIRNPSQSDRDTDGEGDSCDLDDGNVQISSADGSRIEWQPEVGFDSWNLYRGEMEALIAAGLYTQVVGLPPLADRVCGQAEPFFDELTVPAPGQLVFYLVSGNSAGIEGGLGQDSNGMERPNTHPCP